MSEPIDHLSSLSQEDQERLNSTVERFESAIQGGLRPQIEEFVLGEAELKWPILIEIVHADLEFRLKSGESVRVEEYLSRFPELATNREIVWSLIVSEHELRIRRGERESLEAFAFRFPEYRKELSCLPAEVPLPSASPSTVRLNCPLCENPIEVEADTSVDDIFCPACGSTFRIESGHAYTWRTEKLPRLGKFELLEAVGRGAFGTVYRARDKGLDRIVAVKIPRSGQFSSQEDVERFNREARSAAQLNHPGIVPVFEVGRGDEFPFLVSEFVEGITLGDVLSGRRFEFRESAELVAEVAEALAHAHEQGVVHRDIKPSNIILASDGKPKLMDFGLAKRDVGDTTMTVEGQVLGTPAFMSPEQAVGKAHGVDGRSDIYSLGVILYQLLSGELPFRGNHRMLLNQVIHDEPRAPRSLNDRIPRDLQTITTKCMAKEPGRRYQAASELAADLRRWLVGEPISASPVGSAERLWRWSKRNPRLAGLSATVFVLLGSLSIGSTMAMARIAAAKNDAVESASRAFVEEAKAKKAAIEALAAFKKADAARADAEQATVRAEDESARANEEVRRGQEVLGFLVGLFQTADPTGLGGLGWHGSGDIAAQLSARDILEQGVSRIQAELREQPVVRARLLETLGNTLRSLGDLSKAESLLEESLELRRRGIGDELELASCLWSIGWLRHDQGKRTEALSNYREAMDIHHRLHRPEDAELATIKFHYAWLLADIHRLNPESGNSESHTEARAVFREVLDFRRRVLGDKHRDTAIALTGLMTHVMGDDPQEAKALLDEAIEIFSSQEGGDRVGFAVTQLLQATMARQRGDIDEAADLYQESLKMAKQQLGDKHPLVALLLGEIAGTFKQLGDFKSAEEFIRDALEIGRAVTHGVGHPEMIPASNELAQWRANNHDFDDANELFNEVAELSERFPEVHRGQVLLALNSLGICCIANGDFVKSESALRKALAIHPGNSAGLYLHKCEAYSHLARLMILKGSYEEAHKLLQEALELWTHTTNQFGGKETFSWSNRMYALILARQGVFERVSNSNPEQAKTLLHEAVDILRGELPNLDIRQDDIFTVELLLAEMLVELATICLDEMQLQQAEVHLKESIEIYRRVFLYGNWESACATSLLGTCFTKMGRLDEAEPLLLESHRLLESTLGANDQKTRSALNRIVELYIDWGRPGRAMEFQSM